MAMILCPECSHEISDRAPSCPKCGAPSGARNDEKINEKKWNKIALIIFAVSAGLYIALQSLKEESKSPLPVDVTYRSALMGPGLVLAVKNLSNRQLAVLATFKNPTLGQEKSFRLDLEPKGSVEVGHVEGWVFSSGDQIVLSHEEYKPWDGRIP